MTDDKSLQDALAKGIITPEQMAEIEKLKATANTDPDEKIRSVGNLNEIFVTFGTMLLVSAVSGLAGIGQESPYVGGTVHTVFALAAACFFHARKRFRLPIIYGVISAAFSLGITLSAWLATHEADPIVQQLLPKALGLAVLIGGAAYFRIPFLMAPIGILLALLVTDGVRLGYHEAPLKLLLGAVGLSILAVAVFFDLKDPLRKERWSDFAFWSYAVGSPLFVHSLFIGIMVNSGFERLESVHLWLLMLVLIFGITLVGLLINRRALILSTLIYIGIILFRALAQLMGGPTSSSALLSYPTLLLLTLLIIGGYVVVLGSHWPKIRRRVFTTLPPWPWLSKLPPA